MSVLKQSYCLQILQKWSSHVNHLSKSRTRRMSLSPWQMPPLTSQEPPYTSQCKMKYSPHCFALKMLPCRPRFTTAGSDQGQESRQRNYIPRGKVYCQECNYLTLFTFPNVGHELAWKINCDTGEHSWQRRQCSMLSTVAHQWQSQLSHCECVFS